MRGATITSLLLVLAGCESSRPRNPTPRSTTRDAGVMRDGGPGAVRDGGPGAVRDGGTAMDAGQADAGLPLVPYCRQSCQTPADCSQDSAPFDADNYACTRGVCEYLGCNNSAECTDTFGANYDCRTVTGNPTRSCVKTCGTVSDCTQPSALFDTDNYTCASGVCEWLGCNSNDECREAFQNASYICAPQVGLNFDNCILGCANANDCVTANATPAFDIDNYACNANNLCEYVGCNSAAECQASLPNGTWTCR